MKKTYIKPELGNPEQIKFEDVYNCNYTVTYTSGMHWHDGYWKHGHWHQGRWDYNAGCYAVGCQTS